jgi:hypothetical protein
VHYFTEALQHQKDTDLVVLEGLFVAAVKGLNAAALLADAATVPDVVNVESQTSHRTLPKAFS